MELKKITEHVAYIPNSTNIGVIAVGGSAVLIDSGIDGDTAKKVLQLLSKEGLTPKALINTHSHADHCGGNHYLKQKSEIRIYAPAWEADIIENPYFEPFFLFSGANPPKGLQNKFLMAKPSTVDYILTAEENGFKIEGMELKIVPLPGHSVNQIGIAVEGVLFCGDFVFSREVLNKHKIPFCADIEKQQKTLQDESLKGYSMYIPSHGEPVESISEMAEAYLEVIGKVKKDIAELLAAPKTTEQLCKELCCSYEVNMKSLQQFYLMQTAIMAYISAMYNEQMITGKVENNSLVWCLS